MITHRANCPFCLAGNVPLTGDKRNMIYSRELIFGNELTAYEYELARCDKCEVFFEWLPMKINRMKAEALALEFAESKSA